MTKRRPSFGHGFISDSSYGDEGSAGAALGLKAGGGAWKKS